MRKLNKFEAVALVPTGPLFKRRRNSRSCARNWGITVKSHGFSCKMVLATL
jgi:hypothetical protein